jgi:hypothetical protein
VGAKAMKRKLGKKVINKSMTVAEAWNRLDHAEREKRARQARRVGKSAGSTWPAAAVVYEPGREDEFMQSAFGPMVPAPQPTAIQKARQNAADRRYERNMAPVREFTAKALGPAPAPPSAPPRPVVKQLTRPEHAAVAELRAQLARVAHDPVRREEVSARILQITGDPYTWGAV